MPEDLISLPGRSLASLEEAAIRSAFVRLKGNRRRMITELRISKSQLLRKLLKLGLRGKQAPRHLQEADLARAFAWHRKAICAELHIADSTLVRWLNNSAPFRVEE